MADPADPNVDPNPSGDPSDGGAPTGGGFTAPQSQEEFDSMIGKRLQREREQAIRAERERFADYDDLKTKAAKLDEIEAASQTDLDRERAAREQAENDRDAALERANQRLIDAAVLAEATRQKAIKPEHLHRLIDLSDVTVADDGQVNGAQEAVSAFLEANPEYVGGRSNGSADQGARNHGGVRQVTEAELKTMRPEAIEQARKEGRLNDLLGVR